MLAISIMLLNKIVPIKSLQGMIQDAAASAIMSATHTEIAVRIMKTFVPTRAMENVTQVKSSAQFVG